MRCRQMQIPGYRTEAEQATRLGKTIRTLRSWRKRGIGPTWTKAGKTVVYPENSDRDWLRSNEQTPVRERHTQSRQRQSATA